MIATRQRFPFTVSAKRATERIIIARQQRAMEKTDTVARRVDRIFSAIWRDLIEAVKDGVSAWNAQQQVAAALRKLPHLVHSAIVDGLREVASFAGNGARRALKASVALHESAHEAEGDNWTIPQTLRDMFGNMLPDATPESDQDAGQSLDWWLNHILPPMSRDSVDHIIFWSTNAQRWQERIAAITSMASPESIAAIVGMGISNGESRVKIARDLRDQLAVARSSAMRVARTEGGRVANEAAWQSHEILAPMIVGYQIHAVLDRGTRYWHRERDKTIYYREPQEGEKGFDQLPHPPHEAIDPNERPRGEPELALNCRCFLSPVFSRPGQKRGSDA